MGSDLKTTSKKSSTFPGQKGDVVKANASGAVRAGYKRPNPPRGT